MSIEVAPEEYWKKIEFTDVKLYLFSLNIDGKIGWRLLTENEWFSHIYASRDDQWIADYWISEDLDAVTSDQLADWDDPRYIIIPVRDKR